MDDLYLFDLEVPEDPWGLEGQKFVELDLDALEVLASPFFSEDDEAELVQPWDEYDIEEDIAGAYGRWQDELGGEFDEQD